MVYANATVANFQFPKVRFNLPRVNRDQSMERSGFTLAGFDSPMVDWRSTTVIYLSTAGDSKLTAIDFDVTPVHFDSTAVPRDFTLVGFDFSVVDSKISVVNFNFT